MTLVVVGIDPGATGAISILVDGNLVAVEDMPTDQVQVGAHLRSRISAHRLWAFLASAKGAHVFVERPEARPMRSRDKATGQTVLRQPGAAGMLAFGEGYGMLVMGCVAAGMVLTELRPGAWKRAAGVAASKDDARRKAQDTFPRQAHLFARVKDHNRAEACLLGLYGTEKLRGGGISDT